MANYQVREAEDDLTKHRYETLSMTSFNDLHEDAVGFISYMITELMGYETEKYNQSDPFPKNPEIWLDENEADKLISKHKKNSLNYLQIYFDVLKYSDKCLSIFDLLNKNGSALVLIPILDYPKIYAEFIKNADLHINAIFSTMDDRYNVKEFDKKYLLPINCKYLALVITRKKTDNVLLNLEFNSTFYEWDDMEDDLSKLFSKKLRKTQQKSIYKKIINGEAVIAKIDKLQNIESLYLTSEILSNSGDLSKYPKKKLSTLCEIQESTEIGLYIFFNAFDKKGLNDKKLQELTDEKDRIFATSDGDSDNPESGFEAISNKLNYMNKIAKSPPNEHTKNLEGILILKQDSPNVLECKTLQLIHPYEWEPSSYDLVDPKYRIIFLVGNELDADYLMLYLNSEAGILAQKNVLAKSECNMDSYGDIEIPLPTNKGQKYINSAIVNVNKLSEDLKYLKEMLITNPEKSREIDKSLREWLSRLEKLSLDEQIIDLAKSGESYTVEFKSTFSLDLVKKSKEDYMEHNVFKTIAGFLNSKGGSLIVGVSDDGIIVGLNQEIIKFDSNSTDKFLLRFLNKLKSKKNIGPKFFPYIDYQIVLIEDKYVLYVKCKRSSEPCFITKNNREVYYIRQNPGTIALEGEEMYKHIENQTH